MLGRSGRIPGVVFAWLPWGRLAPGYFDPPKPQILRCLGFTGCVCTHKSPGNADKLQCGSVGLDRVLRFCISNKLTGTLMFLVLSP